MILFPATQTHTHTHTHKKKKLRVGSLDRVSLELSLAKGDSFGTPIRVLVLIHCVCYALGRQVFELPIHYLGDRPPAQMFARPRGIHVPGAMEPGFARGQRLQRIRF